MKIHPFHFCQLSDQFAWGIFQLGLVGVNPSVIAATPSAKGVTPRIKDFPWNPDFSRERCSSPTNCQETWKVGSKDWFEVWIF